MADRSRVSAGARTEPESDSVPREPTTCNGGSLMTYFPHRERVPLARPVGLVQMLGEYITLAQPVAPPFSNLAMPPAVWAWHPAGPNLIPRNGLDILCSSLRVGSHSLWQLTYLRRSSRGRSGHCPNQTPIEAVDGVYLAHLRPG